MHPSASPTTPTLPGERIRIAILDDYQGLALQLADWSALQAHADLEVFTTPADDTDALVQRLQHAQVVVAMRERTRFPAEVLERLPHLRLLVSTGLRNAAIDLAACQRLGILTAGAAGDRHAGGSTSELTWALILAAAKRLPAAQAALHAGRWQPALAEGLEGRTLGIVGLGKLGQRVARVAQAFGMQVLAWSPHLDAARAAAAQVEAVDKATLFARSDWVSLHLVLSEHTRHVVDTPELQAMPRHAWLVNTARAALVREEALMDALQNRRIGGAALDVFWQEPLPAAHPLLALDNVLLSPHLGYATQTNMAAFYRHAVAHITHWLDGGTPPPLEA